MSIARAALITALVLAVGTLSIGCRGIASSRPAIVGRLVDAFGHPIVGAGVTIPNSNYGVLTDANGAFSLEYAPGTFEVQINAAQCIRQEVPLTLATATQYDLGIRKLLCPPAPARHEIIITAHDGNRALPRTTLAVRTVSTPGQVGDNCTNTYIETNAIPTLTGSDLLTWLPPQTVRAMADFNFLLARADGTRLDSQGMTLGMRFCGGPTNMTGTRGTAEYAGWHLHRAAHLPNGTYCFIRGARYQMPIAEASEGYCFHWVLNDNETLGPVVTEAPPAQVSASDSDPAPPVGNVAPPAPANADEPQIRTTTRDEDPPPDPARCPRNAQGLIPCTIGCYTDNARSYPMETLPNGEPDFSELV